ncbi:MAG: hypothetical protein AAFX75_10130 [Pseudomonadota bacterium]
MLSKRALTVLACLLPAYVSAQEYSEPADNYLHEVVQEWSEKSKIGSLRDAEFSEDEKEVRFWSGFGLTGTVADTLSWRGGKWMVSGGFIKRYRVGASNEIAAEEDMLPPCVLEEMSRRCVVKEAIGMDGKPRYYSLGCAIMDLGRPEKNQKPLAALWDEMTAFGLLTLPPSVDRDTNLVVLDGLSYVIEVRVGDTYRATVIQYYSEHPVDKQAHEILKAYDAVVGTELYPYGYDQDSSQ